jgi:hypothetical protein
MTAVKPKTLNGRLIAALTELPDVMERDQQRTQGAKYRYLNEAGVLPPIRRVLLAEGLIATASVTSVQRDAAAARVDKKTGEVKHDQVVTVLIDVTITCADTGDALTIGLAGASTDRDGRGVASARTDALKGLRQALLIAADDPDHDERGHRDEPLTHAQVEQAARDAGYTDEQRDLVIAADSKLPPGGLSAVPDEQLDVALDVLRDTRALQWARQQTTTGSAA